MEMDKVHFKLEIRPNLKNINKRILHHLLALGLKMQKYVIVVMSYEFFIHEIYGEFPGGQERLNNEIGDLKRQIGPFNFYLDFKKSAHLFNESTQVKLERLGFRIININKDDHIYLIEFPGPEDEAMSILDDFLNQLFKNNC